MLIVKHIKTKAIIRKTTKRMGGPEVRASRRAERLAEIRREKFGIIQGLINSWDLREIRYPTREEYESLRFFYRGLTINYLRELQKRYWT